MEEPKPKLISLPGALFDAILAGGIFLFFFFVVIPPHIPEDDPFAAMILNIYCSTCMAIFAFMAIVLFHVTLTDHIWRRKHGIADN